MNTHFSGLNNSFAARFALEHVFGLVNVALEHVFGPVSSALEHVFGLVSFALEHVLGPVKIPRLVVRNVLEHGIVVWCRLAIKHFSGEGAPDPSGPRRSGDHDPRVVQWRGDNSIIECGSMLVA